MRTIWVFYRVLVAPKHRYLVTSMNSWTIRPLAKGRKEVLLKLVRSAMRTHVMSCFRLLKTVTRKLTSEITYFWLSCSSNNKVSVG